MGHKSYFRGVGGISREDSQALVQQVIDDFGVSPGQLALLVGLQHHSSVSRWLSGRTMPSRRSWSQLLRLALMHAPKPSTITFPLHRLSRIDWRHGEVFWRDGRVTTLEGELIEYRSRGGRKLRQPGVVVASDYVSSRDHDPADGGE